MTAKPKLPHYEALAQATWLYIKSEPELWTVGFYDPDGKWEPESDHTSSESAAQRVHYLNGGKDEQ